MSSNLWSEAYTDAVSTTVETLHNSVFLKTVGSTNKAHGANSISAPFKGQTLDLSFTRSCVGCNWYDDDFTDGQLSLYFARDTDPITFSKSWGGYNRLSTPADNIRIDLREPYTANLPRIQGSTSYAPVQAIPTWHSWALHRILLSPADPGFYNCKIYFNGTLHVDYDFAFAQDVNSVWRVVFHFHNYGRTSEERLSDIVLLSEGYNIQGAALTEGGKAVDAVCLYRLADKSLASRVQPTPDGNWYAWVETGDYYIAYYAYGCAPVIHGPYLIEE